MYAIIRFKSACQSAEKAGQTQLISAKKFTKSKKNKLPSGTKPNKNRMYA